MTMMVPQRYDRYGLLVLPGSVRWAANNAISTIPNNETIAIFNWIKFYTIGNIENARYIGARLYNATPNEMGILGTGIAQPRFRWYAAAAQDITVDIKPKADALYVQICDRDNSMAQVFIDATNVINVALTQDPNFSVTCMGRIGDGTSGATRYAVWRGMILSLGAGNTPSVTRWTTILRAMRDPHCEIPIDLMNRVGTFQVDWRPGEGLYGSTTVVNQRNPGTDDLPLQAGAAVEDVRTRVMIPKRKTRRTFYTLTPGYTATLNNQDYGFAQNPVVFRVHLGKCEYLEGAAYQLGQLLAAGGDYIYLRRTGIRSITIYTMTNAVQRAVWEIGAYGAGYDVPDFLKGGDLWIVVRNATTCDVYFNGQQVASRTDLTAMINLSGNVNFNTDGRSSACRWTAWNPAAIPASFESEIRQCVMHPERDPASLGVPLVDFPIRSDVIGAASANVPNQGSGGGTLVLSAIRSTSCREMIVGTNP